MKFNFGSGICPSNVDNFLEINSYIQIVSENICWCLKSSSHNNRVSFSVDYSTCTSEVIISCLISVFEVYLIDDWENERSRPFNNSAVFGESHPPIVTSPCDDSQVMCWYLALFRSAYLVQAVVEFGVSS